MPDSRRLDDPNGENDPRVRGMRAVQRRSSNPSDSQSLSDRWTLEPNSGGHPSLIMVSGRVPHSIIEVVPAAEADRLRLELAAWKDENAGVMCEACGIHLNTARAGDAVEKRGVYGGVWCGPCRDCADLKAENDRLRNALIEIGEWDGTRTLGYEGPRDIARRALAAASTTQQPQGEFHRGEFGSNTLTDGPTTPASDEEDRHG